MCLVNKCHSSGSSKRSHFVCRFVSICLNGETSHKLIAVITSKGKVSIQNAGRFNFSIPKHVNHFE